MKRSGPQCQGTTGREIVINQCFGIFPAIEEVMRSDSLRWFQHVYHQYDSNVRKKIAKVELPLGKEEWKIEENLDEAFR